MLYREAIVRTKKTTTNIFCTADIIIGEIGETAENIGKVVCVCVCVFI